MEVEIEAQNIELHSRWRDLIEKKAKKLQRFSRRMTQIRIALVHSRHHLLGSEEVRLFASLPNHTVRVQKTAPQMADAIRAVFKAAETEIKALRALRKSVDRRPKIRPTGTLSSLSKEQGYGFILSQNAKEVYFDRDSVREIEFEKLEAGDAVKFEIEEGRDGSRASRVFPLKGV